MLKLISIAIGAILISGCLPAPDTCRNQICDNRKWVMVLSSNDIWPSLPSSDCLTGYRPGFFERFDIVFTSIDLRPGDLTLAVAMRNGELILAEFGAREASASLDIGAVGVGWSNSGSRLAVVTRDATAGHTLWIFDADLTPLDERPIDLPPPEPGASSLRVIVSWSADDRLVAVSTDAMDLDPNPSPEEVELRCIVYDVAGGATRTYTLANVMFIGEQRAVAIQAANSRVRRDATRGRSITVTLQDGEARDATSIGGVVYVLETHPPSGVFAAQLPEEFLLPGSRPIVLQSGSLRTNATINAPSPFVSLIPIAEVEAILLAVGFGPDASCPQLDQDDF